MNGDHRQRGFSLVELLVVIAILGILATVAVFAVRGINDTGEQSACDSDRRIVTQAMEARFAESGSYSDEATLVGEGFLRSSSQLHDVVVSGDNYIVVGVGGCAVAASTTMP